MRGANSLQPSSRVTASTAAHARPSRAPALSPSLGAPHRACARADSLPAPPLRGRHATYERGHGGATLRAAPGDGVSCEKAELEREIEEQKFPAPEISKSDEKFLKEGIEFVYGADEVDCEDLNELFEKVGFPRRSPERISIALENTHLVLWVRATKKSRWARMGQMLGFARATSDGAFNAVVWDVAVNPAWQRCGLGRGLVERLTARLVEADISAISLYAEPNVVGMYQKLGFTPDTKGVKGMAFQRAKGPSTKA